MSKQFIFVFGSNLRGVHGAGAAQYAHKVLGASWGVGEGPTGQCYALPTKDIQIKTLPFKRVVKAIEDFIEYAKQHPKKKFKVTRVGCGLAGFKDEQIAPLFMYPPHNCYFDTAWTEYLGDVNYWGTM